jgi:hypothetical protein
MMLTSMTLNDSGTNSPSTNPADLELFLTASSTGAASSLSTTLFPSSFLDFLGDSFDSSFFDFLGDSLDAFDGGAGAGGWLAEEEGALVSVGFAAAWRALRRGAVSSTLILDDFAACLVAMAVLPVVVAARFGGIFLREQGVQSGILPLVVVALAHFTTSKFIMSHICMVISYAYLYL